MVKLKNMASWTREEKQSCGPTHTHNASNTTTHPNTQTHAHRRTQQTRTHTHAHTRVPIYTHVTRRNLECWRFLVPRSCGSHKLQNNNTNNNNESGNGEGGWGARHAPALGCPKTRGRRGADITGMQRIDSRWDALQTGKMVAGLFSRRVWCAGHGITWSCPY